MKPTGRFKEYEYTCRVCGVIEKSHSKIKKSCYKCKVKERNNYKSEKKRNKQSDRDIEDTDRNNPDSTSEEETGSFGEEY